jgi:transcriptional regulator with XRE-family HTH domain
MSRQEELGNRPGGADASFGERLRWLREGAGLTQEELASRAGLTAKAVSALERGERKRPYPHTVRSLADALKLSEEERAALAEAVLEGVGLVFYAQANDELHQRAASAARERLGEQAWMGALDEGRAMSFEEAVAYALDRNDDAADY